MRVYMYVCVCVFINSFIHSFIHSFIYERERQTDRQTNQRGRHRIWSRLQALSCQHRAQCRARTHEPWHHDLSQSRTLNLLSHLGATQVPQEDFAFRQTCLFHAQMEQMPFPCPDVEYTDPQLERTWWIDRSPRGDWMSGTMNLDLHSTPILFWNFDLSHLFFRHTALVEANTQSSSSAPWFHKFVSWLLKGELKIQKMYKEWLWETYSFHIFCIFNCSRLE